VRTSVPVSASEAGLLESDGNSEQYFLALAKNLTKNKSSQLILEHTQAHLFASASLCLPQQVSNKGIYSKKTRY